MNKTIFKNSNVKVVREEKDLNWYDLQDKYNDYKGFTKGKRGLEKATAFIIQLSEDERLKYDITMGDITDLMDKFNLKPHTYCGMD